MGERVYSLCGTFEGKCWSQNFESVEHWSILREKKQSSTCLFICSIRPSLRSPLPLGTNIALECVKHWISLHKQRLHLWVVSDETKLCPTLGYDKRTGVFTGLIKLFHASHLTTTILYKYCNNSHIYSPQKLQVHLVSIDGLAIPYVSIPTNPNLVEKTQTQLTDAITTLLETFSSKLQLIKTICDGGLENPKFVSAIRKCVFRPFFVLNNYNHLEKLTQ